MQYEFKTTEELCQIMGVSKSFLRECRANRWQQGIHWVYLNSENYRSGIRYNKQLCLNWLVNKDSEAHQQAINAYLKVINAN